MYLQYKLFTLHIIQIQINYGKYIYFYNNHFTYYYIHHYFLLIIFKMNSG